MNKPDILQQTVSALMNTLEQPYEVIMVDNGSTDPRTLAILDQQEKLGWTIIRNETNNGLSNGTNQGLSVGKYDCLIHLDDDCLITQRGWNQAMRSYFDFPEVGMVVPGTCGEEIRHEHYVELRWALGFCWAIRKELFDHIGGYDPQLMHQNECDMALRVRMAGYRLVGIKDFRAIHNDPGGPRSEIALAREHLGCVQFRDKWTSYFRGRNWNYGTDPIYLMQHWPPDQEFFRRFIEQEGINLNPPHDGTPHDHSDRDAWIKLDELAGQQKITLQGQGYLIFRELRNDYCHWEHKVNPYAYANDREIAIARWERLSQELYEGYKWPHNLLRIES